MYTYRNDPLYPNPDLSQEAMDKAMARGRYLRSKAFHQMALGLVNWLFKPRRPVVDLKSLHNGTAARPHFSG